MKNNKLYNKLKKPVSKSPNNFQNKSAIKDNSFPIVGIGASAGGLAAFEAFFSGIPNENKVLDMALILIQHLDPNHKSILSDIVKRYTKMDVFEVEDGMKIRKNCVYIIPPNSDMALLNGTLSLLKPQSPHGLRLPIDYFFNSLALDQGTRSISIILSGTGSDGTIGARTIKSEGGMVMAQKPESTEYANMPQSAIAAGLVDYILLPSEMPASLTTYVNNTFKNISPTIFTPAAKADGLLKKIFILLRKETSHDFSQYKQNTIIRRIERRMAVSQIQHLEDYIILLQKNSVEIEALFYDLLIGVTNFFRDKDAFAFLDDNIIPKLFEGKQTGDPIRIWVPGCSTGEEAYSLAIMLQEHFEQMKQTFKLQVFATDIDPKAIEQARSGIYPISIANDISPKRLARFFDQEPEGSVCRVKKIIRDLLIFSVQDLVKDPPFSKVDLISCRNLLIYFNSDLQKKLIPIFHYALKPQGKLFLGSAESVGEFSDLFLTVDRKFKVFQKKDFIYTIQHPGIAKFFNSPLDDSNFSRSRVTKSLDAQTPLREMIENTLLRKYAPSSVLVNEHGDILYLHGKTGQFLELAPGKSEMNILKMSRQGLERELTAALHKAVRYKKNVHFEGLKIKTNGDFSEVNLTVQPMDSREKEISNTNLYLVIFEKVPHTSLKPKKETAQNKTSNNKKKGDNRKTSIYTDTDLELLKQKLRENEEFLHASNEELETSNEELKSSNEEMQSVNEELQSSNEELETSREELQSVNEELTTVNTELQTKVNDLSRINNDMNNLLAGTGIGTIFVNHELLIQRFTPSITKVVNLIITDVGRPLGHTVSNLKNHEHLEEDVKEVLTNLIPREFELQTKDENAWYLLHIRPYRTLENVIEGAVLTFVDITKMKLAETALREIENKKRVLFETMSQGILFLDNTGIIIDANPAAEKILGVTLDQIIGSEITDNKFKAIHEDGTPFTPETHPAMIALNTGKNIQNVVMGIHSPRNEKITWTKVVFVPQFKPEESKPYQVYSILENITDSFVKRSI